MNPPRPDTLIRYSRISSDDDLSRGDIECILICTAPVIEYDRATRSLSISGPDVTVANLEVSRFSVQELERA